MNNTYTDKQKTCECPEMKTCFGSEIHYKNCKKDGSPMPDKQKKARDLVEMHNIIHKYDALFKKMGCTCCCHFDDGHKCSDKGCGHCSPKPDCQPTENNSKEELSTEQKKDWKEKMNELTRNISEGWMGMDELEDFIKQQRLADIQAFEEMIGEDNLKRVDGRFVSRQYLNDKLKQYKEKEGLE